MALPPLLLHSKSSSSPTMASMSAPSEQLPKSLELLQPKKSCSRLGFLPPRNSVATGRRKWRNLSVAAKANDTNLKGEEQSKSQFSSTDGRSQTSTVAAPPPFPPPQPQIGSPLLWIGVGVGISIVFSWAARRVQGYAMQQALKSMMQQTGQGGNQFAGGPASDPFVGQSNLFSGPGGNRFASMPPGIFSSSPPTSPAASTTVDVTPNSVSPVQSSPVQSEAQVIVEKPVGTKKSAFTDVDVSVLVREEPQHQEQPSQQAASQNPFFKESGVVDSAAGFPGASSFGSQASFGENGGKGKSVISIEMLETMLDDPKIQQMVFPYLPAEMRDPVTFKQMIQMPQVRKQLQEALNNMGGEDGLDMLKYMNSDTVKQQFEQIGMTPEEVVGKILASPDIAASLQNPKVVEAIMDCSQNPLNITKYQNDKEVMNALMKIAELFPGASGPPY